MKYPGIDGNTSCKECIRSTADHVISLMPVRSKLFATTSVVNAWSCLEYPHLSHRTRPLPCVSYSSASRSAVSHQAVQTLFRTGKVLRGKQIEDGRFSVLIPFSSRDNSDLPSVRVAIRIEEQPMLSCLAMILYFFSLSVSVSFS